MVVHTLIPAAWEVEVEGLQVLGQPEQLSETFSQNVKKMCKALDLIPCTEKIKTKYNFTLLFGNVVDILTENLFQYKFLISGY